MNDARRHLQVLGGAHPIPFTGNDPQQVGQGQLLRSVVHLQRADARGQVDHPGQGLGFQGLHQGVAAKAQHQVQLRCADFQQQVSVPGQPRHQPSIVLAKVEDHRILEWAWRK